jgi:hypothetical protein
MGGKLVVPTQKRTGSMSNIPADTKDFICEYCGAKGHDFGSCPCRPLYENPVIAELLGKVKAMKPPKET